MVALLFVLLVCGIAYLLLRAFFSWERRRMERPIGRERMEAGFTPQGESPRTVLLGLAVASVVWGVYEWNVPSLPPFSGKHVWLKEIAHQAFGPQVAAYLFWLIAVVLCVCALISKRRSK